MHLPLRALNHVSIVVKDVEASIAFYRNVLGFIEIQRPSSFDFDGAWLCRYGIAIHLIRGTPLPRAAEINPFADHLSFQAEEDLAAVGAHLTRLGISFIREQVKEGGIIVDQLFFHGPDNEMIEICNCECLPVRPMVDERTMAKRCVTCALQVRILRGPAEKACSESSEQSEQVMAVIPHD